MNKTTPLRMCMVCRQMLPKRELYRIVKTPENSYKLDKTGKLNGRGYYLCKQKECMEKLLKKKLLSKLMKAEIPQSVYEELISEYESN